MRALVTGATGFIGRHLCRALTAAGDDVIALVRPTSNRAGVAAARFAIGDVTDPASLIAAVAEVDVVFHLAAMLGAPWHPDFLTTNAVGVRNVCAAAAQAARPPRVVATSSIAAAGPARGARTEDDPPAPVSRYGASKLAGEQAAREFAARVPITIVRPPVVFGGGDLAMLPAFRMAARGVAVAPGRGRVSLIHVTDLVAAIRAAAVRGEALTPDGVGRGIYFAGADESPAIPELARRVAAAVGRPRALIVPAPAWAVWAGALVGEAIGRLGGYDLFSRDKAREATAGDWVCATGKARDQLGWTPAATLDARLAETAADYRAAGRL
jgi:nucleoside-diphosphate-sugar epimerase